MSPQEQKTMVRIGFSWSQYRVWLRQLQWSNPKPAFWSACRRAFILTVCSFAITPAAFGQVTISVDAPSSVQLGMGLRYLIQVTNSGATAATALVMTDT